MYLFTSTFLQSGNSNLGTAIFIVKYCLIPVNSFTQDYDFNLKSHLLYKKKKNWNMPAAVLSVLSDNAYKTVCMLKEKTPFLLLVWSKASSL